MSEVQYISFTTQFTYSRRYEFTGIWCRTNIRKTSFHVSVPEDDLLTSRNMLRFFIKYFLLQKRVPWMEITLSD